jgi:hypothetical protein
LGPAHKNAECAANADGGEEEAEAFHRLLLVAANLTGETSARQIGVRFKQVMYQNAVRSIR